MSPHTCLAFANLDDNFFQDDQDRIAYPLLALSARFFDCQVHYKIGPPFKLEDSVTDFLAQRTVDWVASSEPLDTPLKSAKPTPLCLCNFMLCCHFLFPTLQ